LCKIIAVVHKVLDGFSRLSLAQKVLVVLFALLLWFLAIFLISAAIFRSMGSSGSEQANTPSEQANAERMHPNVDVKISSARWEGQKAVVMGSWKGEVSSVRCDLWEGSVSGAPTRWWDRSVGTQMDWSERTFTQEFVSARGSDNWEPLDPLASYAVKCRGLFAGDWVTSDSTRVEGKPTG
jgi:hypothetical protein